MADIYEQRTYNSGEIGFGEKPGIVVVDYMTAFTDPKFPLGGAPLIERGVQNSARLLDRYAVVRSIYSHEAIHEKAKQYIFSGQRPNNAFKHPVYGSVVAKELSEIFKMLSHPDRGAVNGALFKLSERVENREAAMTDKVSGMRLWDELELLTGLVTESGPTGG